MNLRGGGERRGLAEHPVRYPGLESFRHFHCESSTGQPEGILAKMKKQSMEALLILPKS